MGRSGHPGKSLFLVLYDFYDLRVKLAILPPGLGRIIRDVLALVLLRLGEVVVIKTVHLAYQVVEIFPDNLEGFGAVIVELIVILVLFPHLQDLVLVSSSGVIGSLGVAVLAAVDGQCLKADDVLDLVLVIALGLEGLLRASEVGHLPCRRLGERGIWLGPALLALEAFELVRGIMGIPLLCRVLGILVAHVLIIRVVHGVDVLASALGSPVLVATVLVVRDRELALDVVASLAQGGDAFDHVVQEVLLLGVVVELHATSLRIVVLLLAVLAVVHDLLEGLLHGVTSGEAGDVLEGAGGDHGCFGAVGFGCFEGFGNFVRE
ncbi:hypothetical protein ATCV1_Z852L [Acanthocystis turfacea chlorella virus 1]|uniref:Uncharacterized protein Z852L n=1 Tax=Chlorovirus heliozoae TaxID=322019 RepID=A7KAB2_9PHYC|nr:hypothetical protein ATCV1_Z852L [Acanthocystis turfacea chlorella virus 1]ABT16986.1 hypothetical protein ATCV1_Z852L [Acanthocystis turfacea chlorella virus 1]